MWVFRHQSDEKAVLSEHGRWISRLHDDFKVLDQRLIRLEQRVSTIEGNLAELMKLYAGLDLALSKLVDEVRHHRRRGE